MNREGTGDQVGISLGPQLANSWRDLLRRHKKALLDNWFRRMLIDSRFEIRNSKLKKSKSRISNLESRILNRFDDPVAYAFRNAAEAIFQALIDDREVERGPLEYAIKIKAVRGKDPSEGVAFIHLLKDAVRNLPGDSIAETEWMKLDCRVDRIAALASEMFMANRAKIDGLKIPNSKFQTPK